MIEFVTLAEARLQKNRKPVFARAALPKKLATAGAVAPILRGLCTLKNADGEGAHRRPILDFRTSDAILAYVGGKDLARYAGQGVITPDHVIRVKPYPLIVPAPAAGKLDAFKTAAQKAVQKFSTTYQAYFARNKKRARRAVMHDPLPRVVLVPGLGLFGLGATPRTLASPPTSPRRRSRASPAPKRSDASRRSRKPTCSIASIGRWNWPSSRRARICRLLGQVAAITGGAGAIGAATARAFAAAGAEVALLDIDAKAAARHAKSIGAAATAVACDVTDAKSVRAAFDTVVAKFGGVDILVSNAGAAWQGRIGDVDEATLRKSFELNFFAHQKVAQAAVKIMLAQGTGGCLLFNVSKQAVNPGANFGPYGLPKAATLFLVRQYALDYGADGIRANAVNADRIRSGLLTGAFIKQRAKARKVSEKDYMSGNLLQREVTAADVAQAFLAQALALKTTADVTTVDGGNIAAALR